MSDCLFCRIIAGDIKGKIEYQDEEVLILQDINPQAPVHLLILPKKHIEKMSDLAAADGLLAGKILLAARDWAKKNGWTDYRLVFNNGREAGQSVFHIHLHLLSGRRMGWPPG